MKKLDEVEPRTNLQATPAPAGVNTSDPGYHFIITQPGSYYLSANISITKAHGIRIAAEGVTLDLNGFEISRGSGTGGNGIEILSTSHRASVRNGSVKGAGSGVRSLGGPGSSARGCALRDLAVSNFTESGIVAGDGAVLESCRVFDGSGSDGIFAGSGASLRDCTVRGNMLSSGAIWVTATGTLVNCNVVSNTAYYGIEAGPGSSLLNCSAARNTATFGIWAAIGSTITNCSAIENKGTIEFSGGFQVLDGCTITNSSANANSTTATPTPTTGIGFDVGSGCMIQNSTAVSNRGDGIRVTSDTVVRGNQSQRNGAAEMFGSDGNGAAIHVLGSDNRIEGNNATDSDRGFEVNAGGNIITRNTASGNSVNWVVAAGNAIQVVQATTANESFNGNSGGTSPSGSATDPNVNFTY